MEQNSMTALVSAFARAYHAEQEGAKVFCDPLAGRLLRPEERRGIAQNMASGIRFFNPEFQGDGAAALQWIVNHQLGPSPLGRAAFAEAALERSAKQGARQYLIFAAGLDSFAYRQPGWASKLRIFEIDLPHAIADKRGRLAAAGIAPPENLTFVGTDLAQADSLKPLRESAGFSPELPSFCSLLGISYYLSRKEFAALLREISTILPAGSMLALDYPAKGTSTVFAQQIQLAKGAGEAMRAAYAPEEMGELMEMSGFRIVQDLDPDAITARYFSAHNAAHPNAPIFAMPQVNYALAARSAT